MRMRVEMVVSFCVCMVYALGFSLGLVKLGFSLGLVVCMVCADTHTLTHLLPRQLLPGLP